jgi:nucleotide-binding universal stress UspA family protein
MSIFPTRILVATDGSEEAALALTTAADLAKSTNSELHVAYVFPTAVQRPFPNPITSRPAEVLEQELEQAMHQAQEFLDREVEQVKGEGVTVADSHLVRGRPDRELVHISEEIDAGLIVMGSRGLGGVRRALMGSVSNSVVRHAHCPVLIVRH